MCTLTHFVHSLPTSHKKCINEKRRKGKNWAIPFSYLNKDSTLFSYTWFPPFRCYVGKSSQLVFFSFSHFCAHPFAFAKGRGCTRAIGKSWVHGFEMIPPTFSHPPTEHFFSASFFAHSSAPISIYLSSASETSHSECFSFERKERKTAQHTICFTWCLVMPSFFVHVRISTGLVMYVSRSFNDKQQNSCQRALRKYI